MSGLFNFYNKAKKKLTDTVGGLGEVAKTFRNELSEAGNTISKDLTKVNNFVQDSASKIGNAGIDYGFKKPVKMAESIGNFGAPLIVKPVQTYQQTMKMAAPSRSQRYPGVPSVMAKANDALYSFGKAAQSVPKLDLVPKSKNKVVKFVGENIANPIINSPGTIASAFGMGAEASAKDEVTPSKLLKIGGRAASGTLDAFSLYGGGSAAKNVAKAGFKAARPTLTQVVKQGAKEGAKMGGIFGGAYGATEGMQEGDNVKEQVKNAVIKSVSGGVMGAGAGAILGGASSGAGKGAKSIVNDVKKLADPKTIVNPARKYVNTGSLISSDGNYPKMVDPNYFQPESLLFKGFRKMEGTPAGMSIKDVSKDIDKIAAKNNKAKILVENQISNQKKGVPVSEPGFVAPEKIKAPEKIQLIPKSEKAQLYKIGGNPADDDALIQKAIDEQLPKELLPSIDELKTKQEIPSTAKSVGQIIKEKTVEPVNKELAAINPKWHTDYKMIKDDMNQLVKGEAEYMMSLKDEVGGVGTYKKIGEGEIGGDMGLRRYSSNPQWYRDFFEKNGRAPRKWEVMKIAEEELKNGNGFNAEKYNNLRTTLVDIQAESAKLQSANELVPSYNQYQQRAFDKKKERVEAIDNVLNYPAKLRSIGYKKSEIDRIGKDQANRIIKLGNLGYPKNEIQKMDFDRMDLIIDRNVPWQTLKSYYEKKHLLDTNFLDGIDPSELKDINPLMTGGRDVYRNFETVFGKNYPKIKAQLLDPFDAAKGEMIKEQEFLTNEIFENIVKKFGIEKGSKVDKAVVAFGEGKLTLNDLQEQFPKDWQKIVEADQWFKNKYPQLLDDLNAVREANFPTHPLYPETTKIIPKRKDYYRHGQEMEGIAGLRNMFEGSSAIDPALAATSDVTNPKTKWLSFGQQRKGDSNDFGAVEGYLDYIKNHSYAKHVDPFIQKFKGVDDEIGDALPYGIPKTRGLAEELSDKFDPVKQITDSTDQAKIKDILISKGVSDAQSEWMSKELAGISNEDKVRSFLKSKLAKNKNTGINKFEPSAAADRSENKENNFLVFIKNFSRDLAGKTNPIDRGLQENFFGRKALNIVNWTNSRFKANAVLGNLSSSIAQVFNVPQGFASAGAKNSAKGLGDSLAGIFKENTPIKQSSFINERYFKGYNKFDTGILNNTKKFAVWVTGIGDEIGSKFIWNAHYQKALSEGIPNPVKYADDWTRKMVAGRGIGEVPIAQKSKIVQLIAPFQLEVANQWYALRDIAKNDPRKLVMAKKLLEYSVASFLMNRVAKEIRGSDVSFDPFNAMYEAYKEFDEEESKGKGIMKAGGRIFGEIASNLPGGSAIASTLLSETNRKKYMGDADPSRFGTGSGLLLGSGIISGDILTKEGWKKTGGDLASKLVLPYGGKQVQKTIQGANALIDGFTENASGKIMTPIERTPANVVRGLMYGKNAFGEMQDYFDNNQSPLSEQQTEKYKLMGNDPNYYNKILNERKADNERAALKGGKIKGESGQLTDDMSKLSNGNIYVKSLDREFKTEKEAFIASKMNELENSDGNFMDLNNGWVLRKGEDGNVVKQRRDSYDVGLNTARLSGYKKNKDLENWSIVAEKQFNLLNKMILDPSIDEFDKAKIQNALDTLNADIEKFSEYGGFTKPKKEKKVEEKYRYQLVDPELLRINALISGTAARKKPIISKRGIRLMGTRLPSVSRTKTR